MEVRQSTSVQVYILFITWITPNAKIYSATVDINCNSLMLTTLRHTDMLQGYYSLSSSFQTTRRPPFMFVDFISKLQLTFKAC